MSLFSSIALKFKLSIIKFLMLAFYRMRRSSFLENRRGDYDDFNRVCVVYNLSFAFLFSACKNYCAAPRLEEIAYEMVTFVCYYYGSLADIINSHIKLMIVC